MDGFTADDAWLKWSTSVVAENGKVVAVPYSAARIVVVDPADESAYYLEGYSVSHACGTANVD